MPVGVLSETMTALEETHWIARCREKPFWPQRLEIGLAQIVQYIHNTNVKKQRPLTDFLLFREKPKPQGDSQQTIRENFERMISRQK